jgi:CHAD domain-containing protein
MKKLRWDESLSAAQNARAALPELARSYFEEGRKLTARPPSSAALHRFRLDSKALRYTLELFRPCYGAGLERRLAVLRKIQAYLGAINDYATTIELVAARLPPDAPERGGIEARLSSVAKRKSLEFRRYAQRLFHDPGEERRWRNYLSRPRQG